MPWCLVCVEDGKGLEIVQILGHEVDVNFTLSFTLSKCQIQTSAKVRETSSSILDMRRYTGPTKSKLPNSGPRHWNVASAARKKRLPVLEALTSIKRLQNSTKCVTDRPWLAAHTSSRLLSRLLSRYPRWTPRDLSTSTLLSET